ncbi:hypothetical protein Syun_026515 [Stephania yunnanensis]|uniref:K+ potassium transporter C-terminal domain-containing protein n=1 Tax=Stephania yunnanensis TaxID=152371 RepID=A0AAP0EWD2_9MAGN
MGVMYTWNYVYRKKYFYELENKVTVEKLEQIASDPSIKRIPGVGVFYSTLVHGISPIFTHYVENVPALHSVLVFTSIKSVPISEIPIEERFLFRRISRNDLCIFQCVVRYGYKDARRGWDSFGEMLVERLKQFVREEEKEKEMKEMKEKELQVIEDEFENGGVTCLIGESEAVPLKGSSLAKTWIINYFYHFLRKVTRRQEEMDGIPYKRLLKGDDSDPRRPCPSGVRAEVAPLRKCGEWSSRQSLTPDEAERRGSAVATSERELEGEGDGPTADKDGVRRVSGEAARQPPPRPRPHGWCRGGDWRARDGESGDWRERRLADGGGDGDGGRGRAAGFGDRESRDRERDDETSSARRRDGGDGESGDWQMVAAMLDCSEGWESQSRRGFGERVERP